MQLHIIYTWSLFWFQDIALDIKDSCMVFLCTSFVLIYVAVMKFQCQATRIQKHLFYLSTWKKDSKGVLFYVAFCELSHCLYFLCFHYYHVISCACWSVYPPRSPEYSWVKCKIRSKILKMVINLARDCLGHCWRFWEPYCVQKGVLRCVWNIG